MEGMLFTRAGVALQRQNLETVLEIVDLCQSKGETYGFSPAQINRALDLRNRQPHKSPMHSGGASFSLQRRL
jgi:hypothetical protein